MESTSTAPTGPWGSAPETWLETHGDYLYRYALSRLRDESLAEDLVQETLLAALKARHGFDGRAAERTWLTGILKHKIIDQLRRQYREVPLEYEPAANHEDGDSGQEDFFTSNGRWTSPPGAWGDPAKAMENALFWEALARCVERLPARQQQLFVLREVHETSNEAICKELEISPTNAGVLLYRARMSLRQCLELNWFGQPRAQETRR